MYDFFSKITNKIHRLPLITLGELVVIGFFAPKKLLDMQREKKQLEHENPGRKLKIKPMRGWLGFTRLSWEADESVKNSTEVNPKS